MESKCHQLGPKCHQCNLTVGVGIRLTYCHRSWGCLLAADVGLGDAVGAMLVVGMEESG